MYELGDEQSKLREFYYHESNNKNNSIKIDNFMTRYTYVRYMYVV